MLVSSCATTRACFKCLWSSDQISAFLLIISALLSWSVRFVCLTERVGWLTFQAHPRTMDSAVSQILYIFRYRTLYTTKPKLFMPAQHVCRSLQGSDSSDGVDDSDKHILCFFLQNPQSPRLKAAMEKLKLKPEHTTKLMSAFAENGVDGSEDLWALTQDQAETVLDVLPLAKKNRFMQYWGTGL